MRAAQSVLDKELLSVISGRDLIVFDGECVLCSRFFNFMLRHDRDARFSFAMAQSDIGQMFYKELEMPMDDFESILVIVDGGIYTDVDACAAAMGALGWPWKSLNMLRWLPGVIKRPLYQAVARNRYRIFGRYETCLVPDTALKNRFVPGGLVLPSG